MKHLPIFRGNLRSICFVVTVYEKIVSDLKTVTVQGESLDYFQVLHHVHTLTQRKITFKLFVRYKFFVVWNFLNIYINPPVYQTVHQKFVPKFQTLVV